MNIYPTPRTQKITFTGYHSSFTKKLDSVLTSRGEISQLKQDSLVEAFDKIIQKKLKPKNILGEGHHGAVYRIDDKYVIKKGFFEPPSIFDFIPVKKNKNLEVLKLIMANLLRIFRILKY